MNYMIIGMTSMLMLTLVAAITTTTTTAFAQGQGDDDPQRNDFGEGSNILAQTDRNTGEQMGEHSREGGASGTAPYDGPDAFDQDKGRTGIGNIGHPADVANALGSDDTNNDP
jgi:hypothetical protein